MCEICGHTKRVPEEIGSRGAPTCRDCTLERTRVRNRCRYYLTVGIPDGHRLCLWCGRVKPIGEEMTPLGRTCRDCRADRSRVSSRVTRRKRRAKMTPAELAEARAYNREKARRWRATPEGRERHNAAQRAWRERDPEAASAAGRRYKAKIMADPERAQEWREFQRIYHRLWRERKGMVARPPSEEEYRQGNGAEPLDAPMLPTPPLGAVISEWVGNGNGNGNGDGSSYVQLADLTGVSDRTLRDVAQGKRKLIQYATADAIATGLDTPLASLYPDL